MFVFCDGGARGNPGPAAIGAVVYENVSGRRGDAILDVSEYIGEATNNQAEYQALIAGLEAAASLGASSVEIRADSELVVKQLNGEYRVRHPNVKPLFQKARDLLLEFDAWNAEHVARSLNSAADALVNQALDAHSGESRSRKSSRR